MERQPAGFKKMVHKADVPTSYKNEDVEGITLAELEALDNEHIFNQSPEGGEK